MSQGFDHCSSGDKYLAILRESALFGMVKFTNKNAEETHVGGHPKRRLAWSVWCRGEKTNQQILL